MPDPGLRGDGDFDAFVFSRAFAGFGMDAVAVEEFQFFGVRREPDFVQAVVC